MRAGLARWLEATLIGAGIERAHLVGTSYGGFLALSLPARAPERAASLRSSTAAGSRRSSSAGSCCGACRPCSGGMAPRPLRRLLARRRPLLDDPRIVRMALHGQMNHPFRPPGVESLTDDELQSITAPTVVIVAAKSAPFAPAVPGIEPG